VSVSTALHMNAQPSTTKSGVVVLVGVMGTGKSTVGLGVARALQCSFVDLDAQITNSAKCTVSEIFARGGETEFRAIETDVLAMVLDDASAQIAQQFANSVVVATGGGAIISQANRDKITSTADHVIWLDAHVDDLVRRTSSSTTSRPLLANNPQQVLSALSSERASLYEQVATTKIDTTGMQIEQVIDAAVQILRQSVDK
jgi:shikimate kinase